MRDEIINTVIEKLQNQLDIKAKLEKTNILDGKLILNANGKKLTYYIYIKKEPRNYHLTEFEKFKEQHQNLIIIAEHIFPNIKKDLRKQGIAYIETSGNLFIKNDTFFWLIDTNKKNAQKKRVTNRAFTRAGLQVVFHFLIDKDLINTNQRNIANITGVALGNIPQVIKGLKEQGFLLRINKRTYSWENLEQLMNRWINGYATTLKPKLKKNTYAVPKNWESIDFNPKKTVWGGEPAADILTNHLRPEKFILYTKENNIDLIKNYRLIPKQNGALETYEMFWDKNKFEKTAPPLLVYAELILEGGKRNNETAKLIFDEYIQPKL